MIRTGEMVRRGGGPPMRVVDIFHDMARCVFVDSHGRLHQRFCLADELTPLWLSLQPRTLWPDPGNLDAIEIAEEERRAAAERHAAKKAAKKAHRSNKAKRRAA